jgi:hypothetical protein
LLVGVGEGWDVGVLTSEPSEGGGREVFYRSLGGFLIFDFRLKKERKPIGNF